MEERKTKTTCIIADCLNKRYAAKMCKEHYLEQFTMNKHKIFVRG